MTKYLLAIFLLLPLMVAFGQTSSDTYGKPVIVLVETDPWLMVIGSDSPTFALYENGQIIYKKAINKEWKYFEVQNDKQTIKKIIASLGIADSLMQQQDYIVASNWTDQPTNILRLDFDTLKQISVYGSLRRLKSEERQKTPNSFLTVYDNIIKFEDSSAVEWLPDTFEVLATNYSYSPEEPLQWKSEWNDINSKTTVKRSADLYSIYLDKKYFQDFIQLLISMKEKQAVVINGEKYSLSYKLPFPNLH